MVLTLLFSLDSYECGKKAQATEKDNLRAATAKPFSYHFPFKGLWRPSRYLVLATFHKLVIALPKRTRENRYQGTTEDVLY
jgi:hypothetical protein